MPRVTKPELMPSEIVLLFWAKIGMGTPYALFNQAGIATGASSPALQRLQKAGLLTAEQGPRNRVSYTVTAEGEVLLRAALEAGPEVYGRRQIGSSYQSLHRAIFFAWVKGDMSEALAAIDSAAQDISWQAARAHSDAGMYRNLMERTDLRVHSVQDHTRAQYSDHTRTQYLAAAFRMIEAVAHSAELTAQENALQFLTKLVGELPSQPETFLQTQLSSEPGQRAKSVGGKRNRKK